MQANIKGLVDRLELSQAKAMMPLYEAISNAVDAIEEHQDGIAITRFVSGLSRPVTWLTGAGWKLIVDRNMFTINKPEQAVAYPYRRDMK